MNITLKIISFVLLGIGAFLVYGAKIVATRMEKGKGKDEHGGDRTETPQVSIHHEALENGEDESTVVTNSKYEVPSRTVLNIKMAGLLFVFAGGILAMVAFR